MVLGDGSAVGAEAEGAVGPVSGGEGRGSTASAILFRVGCRDENDQRGEGFC